MTKTNLITVSNENINAMVVAYQADPSEFLYADIHEAVSPMAEKVAYKIWHGSQGLNVSKDEFKQCAFIAIFKAVSAYDPTKGGQFTSLVKQLVEWTIQDDIFKKHDTHSAQFHKQALSLDKPVGEEGTFMDAIEYQYATDVDAVFNAMLQDDELDLDSLTATLLNFVSAYDETASKEDSKLIKVWVTTLLKDEFSTVDTKKAVNDALAEAFSELSSTNLRQKKSRTEKKFNKFVQELGFTEFKLSHF